MGYSYVYNFDSDKLDLVYVAPETDPLSVHLDQTSPQTMTLGSGTGLISLTAGVIGLDTSTYLTTETDPAFTNWLSSTPPLYPGGWYDTDQYNVYVSGFYNDSGYLTYWDSIGYADSSNYAYNADYASYSSYAFNADYVTYENDPTFGTCPYDGQTYGWSNGAWTVVAGDTTFTQWRAGTAFSGDGDLVGPCEFNDVAASPTKYARYWNVTNSSLAEWWDGTNTFTMGGTSGLSYIAGASDVLATLNGTFAHFIDAGTSIPFSYTNTKDSTDSVIEIGRFGRATTGTPAAGIGGALPIYLTNSNGDEEIFGQIEVVGTDVTDGAEYGDVIIKNVINTTLINNFKLSTYGVQEKLIYGSMYMDNGSQSVTISSSNTWYEVAEGFSGGAENGMTFQNSKEILVLVAGKYKVDWSLSYETTNANVTIEGAVLLNGTYQPQTTAHTTHTTATDVENMGGTGILTLAVNDVVSLGINNNTSATDATVSHGNMTLLRIDN